MSLRIAMISEHASPLAAQGGVDSGGQNVYVRELARHLAELGCQVDVFTRRDAPNLRRVVQMARGVRVVHVPAGPPAYVRKEDMLPLMPEFTRHMLRACAGSPGYDLLHANFWMSGLVAADIKRLLGIPFAVTFHALGRVRRAYLNEADDFPDERFAVEDRVVSEADVVLAECPEDEADLIRLYDIAPEKLRLVPCGIDPAELYPVARAEARLAIGVPQDARLLLHVGRIVQRKGVDNVIRGLARLRHAHGIDAQLLIVGAGYEEADPRVAAEVRRLLAIAEDEGVAEQVAFAGYVERDRLRDYYSAADVFVTTPWYEPFGITPLEAMACGVPVIGANVGGIKYTVRDGETGYLVPPDDPDALARRAADLFRYPKLMETMRTRALDHVRASFTWRRIAHMATDAFSEALVVGQPKTNAARVVHRACDDLAAVAAATRGLWPAIEATAEALMACFANGGKVLVCGNGGSAAEAQHFAGELVGRFRFEGRRALPAVALTTDSSVLTGWSNDVGYEHVFARQVEALGSPGDVLVAISTSGNSPNLLRAFETAGRLGLTRVSISAAGGGVMHALDDHAIIVPTNDPQRAQEVQLAVVHALCELIDEGMALQRTPGGEATQEAALAHDGMRFAA